MTRISSVGPRGQHVVPRQLVVAGVLVGLLLVMAGTSRISGWQNAGLALASGGGGQAAERRSLPPRRPAATPVAGLADARSPAQGLERVYLVPLGEVFSLDYDGLASYYRQRFGLAIAVMPPVPLTAEQIDPRRRQLVAEALIARMRTAYPDLDRDLAALLIGVSEYDMYLADTPDWRYGFALRVGGRHAVISSARMDDFNYGGEPDPALLHTRVRKMITKTLGLLYFGMPLSDDPRSVLYRSILGVEDLDAVSEEF